MNSGRIAPLWQRLYEHSVQASLCQKDLKHDVSTSKVRSVKMLTFGQDEDTLFIPMCDGTAELAGRCSIEIDVILAFNELKA